MKKEITNLPASVRARLFNKAKAEGRSFDEVLLYYAMERFLFRRSVSPHAGKFVLKGALMLQFWGGPVARSTRDIDLMGWKHIPLGECAAIIRECFALVVPDDGMRFDPASLDAEEIRTGARYEGVRIRFRAYLGTARVHLQLDIGSGDVVTPATVTLCGVNGGGAWESNPPTVLFARHTGFEVLEAHQVPVHPRRFGRRVYGA